MMAPALSVMPLRVAIVGWSLALIVTVCELLAGVQGERITDRRR